MKRELDVFKMTYRKGSKRVGLTRREYQVLYTVAMGRATQDQMVDLLEVGLDTMNVHICNLRKKLGELKETLIYDEAESKYYINGPIDVGSSIN